MNAVEKLPLRFERQQTLLVKGSLLGVGFTTGENAEMYVFALLDTESRTVSRIVEIVGTGQMMASAHRRHLGTIENEDGSALHIFERLANE